MTTSTPIMLDGFPDGPTFASEAERQRFLNWLPQHPDNFNVEDLHQLKSEWQGGAVEGEPATITVGDREYDRETLQRIADVMSNAGTSSVSDCLHLLETAGFVLSRIAPQDDLSDIVRTAERCWDMLRYATDDSAEARQFNTECPIGTAVCYFDEGREESYLGRTVSRAMTSAKYGSRVLVDNCEVSVALSDVQRAPWVEAVLCREGV